jgi:FkbM family methyltransferase
MSFFGKVKLCLWSSWAPLARRMHITVPAMSLYMFGTHPIYFTDSTDVGTFLEVFLHEEYSIAVSILPRTILDLGANSGYTSIYFAHMFPHAKIIAVEADPKNIQKIKKNAESFGGQIVIEPSAVAAKSGSLDFYLNFKTSISGSAIRRDGTAEKITVPALSLADLEKKYGHFDIVKFDIEGGEWSAIDVSFLSSSPSIFIGEYHEDIIGKSIDDFLVRFGNYSAAKKKIANNRFLVTLVSKK